LDFSNYVNPNAICPVCGEDVYYIEFWNGGRVFFDELGPPWPKHLCTDNGTRIVKPNITNQTKIQTYPNIFDVKDNGWIPALPKQYDYVKTPETTINFIRILYYKIMESFMK